MSFESIDYRCDRHEQDRYQQHSSANTGNKISIPLGVHSESSGEVLADDSVLFQEKMQVQKQKY